MKLGFIGARNMAKAMIGGILKNNIFKPEEVIASDLYEPGLRQAKESLGIHVTTDNKEVARTAEVLVLSVKPQFYEEVICEIKDVMKDNQIVVTIAPGKTLAWLEEKFGKPVKLVRTMPNTPAMVQEGMTGVCKNTYVTESEMERVCDILRGFGEVEIIPERLIDAVVTVSGSSPAYVFMMIEAMADAAVAEGMPRKQAYKFAAKAVMGSAKMVLETGKHPGELKDMVCSPAWTTIEAVKVLEAAGFRSALMEAMEVCAEKSRNM